MVEQPGRIEVLRKGKRKTFLDIRGEVLPGGEQGLLSVAFAPDYQQSGFLYVYYVTNSGDLAIEEYKRASASRADRGSARRVLTVNHPGQPNHNGGQLQFGPDGFLYIGTGDGGGGGDPDNSAQDTGSLLGKILRIDPRPSGGQPYGSPGSNPFVGDPGRDEIYALGLRNPFRFSFDRVSRQGARTSSSATSARTASRRSTTRRSQEPGARTSAGTTSRATPPSAAPRRRLPRATTGRSRSTASAAQPAR